MPDQQSIGSYSSVICAPEFRNLKSERTEFQCFTPKRKSQTDTESVLKSDKDLFKKRCKGENKILFSYSKGHRGRISNEMSAPNQVTRCDHTDNGSDQVCAPPHTYGQMPERSAPTGTLRMVDTAKNDHGNHPLTSDMCEVQIPKMERAQATSTSVQSPGGLPQDVQPTEDTATRVAMRASSTITGLHSCI